MKFDLMTMIALDGGSTKKKKKRHKKSKKRKRKKRPPGSNEDKVAAEHDAEVWHCVYHFCSVFILLHVLISVFSWSLQSDVAQHPCSHQYPRVCKNVFT